MNIPKKYYRQKAVKCFSQSFLIATDFIIWLPRLQYKIAYF